MKSLIKIESGFFAGIIVKADVVGKTATFKLKGIPKAVFETTDFSEPKPNVFFFDVASKIAYHSNIKNFDAIVRKSTVRIFQNRFDMENYIEKTFPDYANKTTGLNIREWKLC